MDTNLCKIINVNVDRVVENAVDCAISKGLVILKSEKSSERLVEHIPFTLFPTPFPDDTIRFLEDIQPHFNRLYYLAGQDQDFIKKSLQSGIESDEFIKRLYQIYEEVQSCQHINLEIGMIRSDYMLKCEEENGNKKYSPKQIETNIMSISHYCSATRKLKELYSNTLRECGLHQYVDNLEEGKAAHVIAKCFGLAWETYGKPNAVIAFVVAHGERRIFEQRELEYEIRLLNTAIPIRRKYFDDLVNDAKLSEDKTLFIDNEEVAVVCYYSADYFKHYKTEEHWRVRLDIEKSKAAKSPSIKSQLAETYKIQQVLAEPGVLERFIKDPEIALELRRTFVNLYSLSENKTAEEGITMALLNPNKYVLKPLREGDINFFEEDMVKLLNEIRHTKQKKQYILMERIFPKTTSNIIIRNGKASQNEVISEIGIIGAYFCKDGKFIANYTAGHLLKSKPKESNDATGSVADIALRV